MKTCKNTLIILCFIIITFTGLAVGNPNLLGDRISINCGSTAASTGVGGREWLGDVNSKFSSSMTVKGSSTRSSVNGELTISVDPVPCKTARISRSQFSYTFQLNPGQKFIRLHFNPASYNGFRRHNDFFNVEAGNFTLLTNFSASITANALAVRTFAKEFCIIVQEYEPFNIVFSPAISSRNTYAFVNGIEIISVPSTLSYCHGGDIGVRVIGHKSVIYIDNSTALEMVHRQNVRWGSVSSGDDITGMFGMWGKILKGKGNKVNNMTWRVPVDVGFRYLVRLHFCETGLKMAEAANKDFIILINHMNASTSADILQQRADKDFFLYHNFMVMVKGHRRDGKHDIFVSLHSKDEFVDGYRPLEGFEVFKLSNDENSLASPNPLPPTRDTSFHTIQVLVSVLGRGNAIATVVIAVLCLVNIIVHMLPQNTGANNTKEESKPSDRAKRLCRLFSVAEIQSATDNFHDAYVVGKGGFGKVYKGLIDNGEVAVAIKRLKLDSKQGIREFWTEVETLSELRHVNLVPLIGYCNEQREMMLLYEYMPTGSLADHLYKLDRKSIACLRLSWKQRLKICIGAGRGLDYLHTGHGIIHRDVKASNILLDNKMIAKVSDFGLAKTGSISESQTQASTNLKGTFGYIDPDYFRTRKLTTKSDVYSFGVVLLEVLCGRAAVEPLLEEDRRSLTMWARDSISMGQADQIMAPSLRGEISPDSLKTFVGVAKRCLLDEPKKRPTMSHVVIKLEFALEQQENAESLSPKEITGLADFFPSIDISQREDMNSLVPNERDNVANVLAQKENVRSPVPNEITNVAKSFSPVSTRLTAASSNMQAVTSLLSEQINGNMINSGKNDERKSTMHKLSRKLWPWDALWKTGKSSKTKHLASTSTSTAKSAPMPNMVYSRAKGGSPVPEKTIGSNQLTSSPNLRIFSFSELKAATRNFSKDAVLGEGGFGIVYKGWLKEGSTVKNGGGSHVGVAIKKLGSNGFQGVKEWMAEVNLLGKLSHPNLVKLLGYCSKDKELLVVYEFMQKGSLEVHLFTRDSAVQPPLPWDIRLKILVGAARGLAFLHEQKVIHRDLKSSNILLDESYQGKLSDFGLAKSGPEFGHTHVSTQIVGTYGYASPEYIVTGHLTTKSDVYGFGVVLVEMLTGLRVVDTKRPPEKQMLINWIKPYLFKMSKLEQVMDPRLEGSYDSGSALVVAQSARSCLEPDPKRRPPMEEIVEVLERIDSAVAKPKQQPRLHRLYLARDDGNIRSVVVDVNIVTGF